MSLDLVGIGAPGSYGGSGFHVGDQQVSYQYDPLTMANSGLANAQNKYNYQSTTSSGPNNGMSQSAIDARNLASIPVNAQMQRFNSILPLLTNQFSRLNSNFATAGGSNGAPPPITAGPVLNPQQIQQQVNQSRAANDQNTAGQMARSDASLAGRGFGSGSPLSMALNGAMQGQNMATNTANETNTRLNAAQQNASQLLNSQQALSNQWATGNQLDIQRRAPIFAQQNALIAALSGLV